MATTSPLLLILGAGPNIGAHVARAFAAERYRVATTSRARQSTPRNDGQLHITSDLSDPSAVSKTFAEVRKSFGEPNVVVYNAAANTAIDEKNPATLPYSALSKDLAINTLSVLAAAEEAVKGFRELPKDVSKAFIYTGNMLNIYPIPGLLSNGVGKAATAHLIATMASAYRDEGFNFYYADERKADGAPAYAAVDGDAHARMYLQLAEGKESVPWHATFVESIGYKEFSSDARSKV